MKKIIHNETVLEIIVFMLMLLFMYAAVSKLMSFKLFEAQLSRAILIAPFSGILWWAVPAVEIIVTLLLFVPRTRLIGLYGSIVLMVSFTVYIGTILLFFYDSRPCTCGGILSSLGWTEHLIFNMAFVVLSAVGVKVQINKQASQLSTTI